jgi:glyoxylase-like metal-dependent hydrolase (beta-lactamase superfamily II)
MRAFPKSFALGIGALSLVAQAATAQTNFDTVRVRAERLSESVYVLFGAGGNIGLSVGRDGAFIIDDQFAPLSEKIKAAVAAITDRPVRFVVNTHWHGDHTGGNANFGRAGSVIIAHDNVRRRMSTEQVRGTNRTPPSPPEALPVITFTQSVSLHLNGDSVRVVALPASHTDGDALIYFTKANVLHMGDTFFFGAYPFVDRNSGGSFEGVIAVADTALALTNAATKIIPGHGPVATRAELQDYRRVLATVRDRIKALVVQGKTLPEVAAAKPTAEFDDRYGRGFINADAFLDMAYNDLKAKYAPR